MHFLVEKSDSTTIFSLFSPLPIPECPEQAKKAWKKSFKLKKFKQKNP